MITYNPGITFAGKLVPLSTLVLAPPAPKKPYCYQCQTLFTDKNQLDIHFKLVINDLSTYHCYNKKSSIYTIQCTLFCVHYSLYNVHFTMYLYR